jgi:hypothetical protein
VTRAPAATAPEVLEARRGAGVAAIIAILGQTTLAVIDARDLGFGPLVVARLAHVAIASIAFALLALRRPSIRLSEVAFALVAIPFQLVLLVSELEFAARGLVRAHGTWYQLTILGIASLAPADPILPSLLVVALGVQRAALRFILGATPVSPGEPWFTLIFAAVAIGMLVTRARRREAVARAARIEAHAAALERVARLLLLVRDRANTPLQTVALGAAIMRKRCADQQRVAAAMDRAVRRLRRLSKALQRASRTIERESSMRAT